MKEIVNLIAPKSKSKTLVWFVRNFERADGEKKFIHYLATDNIFIRTEELEKKELSALVEAFGRLATPGQPLSRTIEDPGYDKDFDSVLAKTIHIQRMFNQEFPLELTHTGLVNKNLNTEILICEGEYYHAWVSAIGLTGGNELYLNKDLRLVQSTLYLENRRSSRQIEVLFFLAPLDEANVAKTEKYLIKTQEAKHDQ